MNIQNIEKKEKNMATFEVKVPADVFDNAVNEAYKKNKNHLYVAGFRKGKAPRAVIEGMYGKEVFYPDAIEALAEDAFEAGRADCGFECVGAPSLIDQKVTEDKELIYTFEVGMYPEVELGQYKGLEVPQNHEAFDESKVDEEMLNVQKRNARLIDVEREAKMGDHVTIDFAGFIDGEQFENLYTGKLSAEDLKESVDKADEAKQARNEEEAAEAERIRKEEEARLMEELKKYDVDYMQDDDELKEEEPSEEKVAEKKAAYGTEGDFEEENSQQAEEPLKEDEEEHEGKR